MKKPSVLIPALLFLLLAVPSGIAQEKPQEKPEAKKDAQNTGSKIPPQEAQRQNPIKPTPASLATGKKVYGYDCAVCHGKEGDGKGELVESMKLKLRDLREPAALKDFTDGELFYLITKGKGDMPGEEGRMKPEECWQLVNYIRSLAKKESVAKAKEEKPE